MSDRANRGLAPRGSIEALVAVMVAGSLYHPAHAQDAEASSSIAAGDISEIVVTGSRFGGRLDIDSSTPIDSITADDLAKTGAPDLKSALNSSVPSFAISRPAASGALDFLQTPTLRGLSPGQVLVLLNGKRRHTSSTLNLGSVTGRGDIAYDFNAIPALALARVEVLRDGAAAQYGSDAIAGVMNLVLETGTDIKGFTRYAQTSESDGEDLQAGVSGGFKLGEEGSLRITAQYQDRNETDRALPDTRQQYFGSNGATLPSGNFGSGTGLTPSSGTLDPREATYDRHNFVFGDPKQESWQLFANGTLPLNDAVELYAFGGLSRLEGTSFNFFRRAGQDETVRAIYPDGYLPLQEIVMKNHSGAAGLRGEASGFAWDLSSTFGASEDELRYSNSNNVSLGAASQTEFFRGSSKFRQWTNNLDVSREFDVGNGAPLGVAFGLEYRKEYYDVTDGELNSYSNGGVPISGGPNNGRPAPVGAQPGGGLTPAEAVSTDRSSKAVYAEVEKEFFDRLRLTGAARYEDFTDFGDTTNYKLAARFEIVDGLALRSSYGTGFRAPALAQSYFSQTNIVFVNGSPLRTRVISVNDPIAPIVGASALKPEEATNLSVGAVVNLGRFTASVDYYDIQIDDRIVASSIFQSTALTNLLGANGLPGIAGVSYITNAVDTTTQGVDVTAQFRQPLGRFGTLDVTFGYNHNETELDRIAGTPAALSAIGISTVLFDLTQQVRFTNSTPKDKATLNLSWSNEPFSVSLSNTLYGEVSQVALTSRTPAQVAALTPGYDVTLVAAGANQDIIQHFGADIVTDLEFGYQVTDAIRVTLGANNLFDTYPDEVIASTVASVAAGSNGSDNVGTLPYAIIAPYGFNGRLFYGRVSFDF